MEDSQVYSFAVNSHKGPYAVKMFKEITNIPWSAFNQNYFFIVDKNVDQIYCSILSNFINENNSIKINATEELKDLEQIPNLIKELMEKNVKRNTILVAIGGGITQDLTCYIASTLFRGMSWKFIPTTLLAQSDSCIGSKSSINVKGIKNLVGSFYPPHEIFIASDFLKTLTQDEIFSGLGEMIKVHIIDGQESFDKMNFSFQEILDNENKMLEFIKRSLEIKKRVIEKDEFDVDYRNIMNYGHTFGHAIETATHYKIPHGIAISIGMDMANFTAHSLGLISPQDYNKMNSLLQKLYLDFKSQTINLDSFFSGIRKDKKNIGTKITLILPQGKNCEINKFPVENDSHFQEVCISFFKNNGFKV